MDSSAFMDNLRQLFAECDSDNNGSLGRHEFRRLCEKIGLNKEAADETFARLDVDKNDRITFDEFAAGFNQYKQTSSPSPTPSGSSPVSPSSTPAPQPVARQSPVSKRLQRPSASPVSSRARKNVSPIGVLSLGGSAGSQASSSASSGNQQLAGAFGASVASTSSGSQALSSSLAADSVEGEHVRPRHHEEDVIVYSGDAMDSSMAEFDGHSQTNGQSGQFGSFMSGGSGSFSQMRNMQDLLECVQKLQSENQILTQIFFKDKREREEYISQLGEEFDQQVREVEERANRRAMEELENEKKRLREMMQTERETLQHHYQTIEKMSKLMKSPNGKLEDGDTFDKVRSRLEDTFLENRQLKRSLLDTKSDVALIRKEMEKLKFQYEDKLSNAYERNNETRSECDHIKQQLNLMKDSNRKLQDASDVLTTYITDKVEPVIKSAQEAEEANYPGACSSLSVPNRGQANSRRGSILSEYIGDTQSMDAANLSVHSGDTGSVGSSRADDRSPTDTRSTRSQQADPRPAERAPKGFNLHGSVSSNSISGDRLNSSSQQQQLAAESPRNTVNSLGQSASSGELAPKTAAVQEASIPQTKARVGIREIGRSLFSMSRANSEAAKSQPEPAKSDEPPPGGHMPAASADSAEEPLVEPADGPSTATFNIILVGDSFVGKSSFAARFMEGSFVQGLISNCSIDFKTKSYKVDGVNYTVNLWDTAGQERFRSITASYFRKADGIILMYDVTDKRSYMNVRNWMSTISDTAAENVAVLLIGNKIDLRNKDNKDKCVPNEEGLRLAKEYDIVFLETSVKTGTNLVPSMGKLIRLIAKNNLPEEDTDRIRLNDKSKTFNCMPKNC